MNQFNPYEFYKLSEEERRASVGKAFEGSGGDSCHYICVEWDKYTGLVNYGRKVGLIRIGKVNEYNKIPSRKHNHPYNASFCCGVASPDDWDYSFGFELKDHPNIFEVREKLFDALVRFAQNFQDVTEKELFRWIFDETGIEPSYGDEI